VPPTKKISAEPALVSVSVKIDKALNDELDTLIHEAKMEGLVPRNFGKSDVLREAIRKELPVFREKLTKLRRQGTAALTK
jgi:metal-responsive CopG/Arc/MetJ family transcriptional regulator